MRTRAVTATTAPAPFDAAWLDTVFLVPQPPAEWPPRFAVVTAHNPRGRTGTADGNAAAERELDQHLRREGIASFVVVGASPDLSHRETSHAFATDSLEQAAGIAGRFGQQGFFWIEGGDVFACVDASGRGWKLGGWTERVVSTRP